MLDGGEGSLVVSGWYSVAIDVVIVSSGLSRVVRTTDVGKDIGNDVIVVVVVSSTGETIVSVGDRVVRDVVVVHAIMTVVSIRVVIE